MTDRELLELAAKAAGIEVWFPRMADGKGGVLEPCHTLRNGQTEEWNPLEDDGDAFRLQVALQLELEFGSCFVNVGKSHGNDGQWHLARESAFDLRATRRAIVRAAAEIGKTM
jgi:hypothetical protein